MKNKTIIIVIVSISILFFVISLIIFLNTESSNKKSEIIKSEDNIDKKEIEILKLKQFVMKNNWWYMKPLLIEVEKPTNNTDLYEKFINILFEKREDYITPVPENIKLRTIYFIESKSLLIIDIDDEFIQNFPSGTRAELEFVYYIVDNICYNFKEIKKVKFLFSGNEYKYLTGHLDFENPFFPNYRYIRDE